jgi:Zn-dependent protease
VTDAAATPEAPPQPARKPRNLVGAAILALWIALGAGLVYAPQAAGPLTFAFVMVGWILAVMAHEFSHALVAWLGGDHTVAQKGYLSFDPRRYGDVGTSLVLPLLALALGGVGFPGGAVYLRPDLMRNRLWRSASALAGPGATLVILLVLTTVLRAWLVFGGDSNLFAALTVLAYLQAMALILNILPLPGLDGFNVIRPFLPDSLTPHLRKAEGLTIGALFILIFLVPGVGRLLFSAAAALSIALGVLPEALQAGWQAFHFWR